MQVDLTPPYGYAYWYCKVALFGPGGKYANLQQLAGLKDPLTAESPYVLIQTHPGYTRFGAKPVEWGLKNPNLDFARVTLTSIHHPPTI